VEGRLFGKGVALLFFIIRLGHAGAVNLNFMPQDISLPKAVFPRQRALFLSIAAALSFLFFFPGSNALGQDPPLGPGEEAVALVNGTPIYPSDLNCALEAALAKKTHLNKGPSFDNPIVLNHLIDIELLYQESLKHHYPGLVKETENIFAQEIENARGREKLKATLACNGISVEQFKRSIFRNVSIRRLLDETVYSRITVTGKEIGEHYEENLSDFKIPESVTLRQIFIRIPSSDKDTLRKVEIRARGVFRQAAKGEDFISLARKYSDDPGEADSGGEMGVIFKGNLHDTLESVVFGQREGCVTEPVRSPRGFHIFQIVSFSPSSLRPLEEVQETISERIRREKARGMVSDFILTLREKASIVLLDKENGRGENHEHPAGVRP